MKPPLRPRLAPARYVTGPGAAAEPDRPRAAWSAREKRALLAALRAQAALGLPDLQPRPLRERLPRRSEAEVGATGPGCSGDARGGGRCLGPLGAGRGAVARLGPRWVRGVIRGSPGICVSEGLWGGPGGADVGSPVGGVPWRW